MKIDISQFGSMNTAIEPELLGDNFATLLANGEVYSGSLKPLKDNVLSDDVSTSTQIDSISRLHVRDGVSKLVTGQDNQDWQVSPLAQDDFDRIYVTSDSNPPKVAEYQYVETSLVDLGIEAPSQSINIVSTGTGDDVQATSVVFVEESQWGELSAPKPSNNAILYQARRYTKPCTSICTLKQSLG
ncbi:hypothetical protein THIOSC15_820003 [uncultured Thiomicrorhabdus sp.]